MFALLAFFCFVVALIVSLIEGTSVVMFFTLVGFALLALSLSTVVRNRLGSRW